MFLFSFANKETKHKNIFYVFSENVWQKQTIPGIYLYWDTKIIHRLNKKKTVCYITECLQKKIQPLSIKITLRNRICRFHICEGNHIFVFVSFLVHTINQLYFNNLCKKKVNEDKNLNHLYLFKQLIPRPSRELFISKRKFKFLKKNYVIGFL